MDGYRICWTLFSNIDEHRQELFRNLSFFWPTFYTRGTNRRYYLLWNFWHTFFLYFIQLESVLTEEEKLKYLDKFRKFVNHESFFGYMVELVSPKNSLSVLCHGDCWTNNFLFQYAPDGSISEVSGRFNKYVVNWSKGMFVVYMYCYKITGLKL